jgi:small-conductance mechanosensitive channel
MLQSQAERNVKPATVHSMRFAVSLSHISRAAHLCLAAFFLTMTWLCYTVSTRARSRAHCCGNHVVCVRYTCDLTWDILLLFFWALMLAAVACGLAFYDKLVDVVDKARAEIEERHVPGSALPGPLTGVRLEDMTRAQREALLNLGNKAGVVSTNDLDTYSKLSRGAEIFLDSGRIILIVVVALAAIQVVSFIITAALSGANRNTVRKQMNDVALPVAQVPKPVVDMGRLPVPVAAKPIVY